MIADHIVNFPAADRSTYDKKSYDAYGDDYNYKKKMAMDKEFAGYTIKLTKMAIEKHRYKKMMKKSENFVKM